MLAKEGARLREKQGGAVNSEPTSDEEEEDEEEDVEEELGFISPLDSADPYIRFKQALTSELFFRCPRNCGGLTIFKVFQMRSPTLYQASTTALNIEQQTVLMEVMTIADKNDSAAKASA